MLVETDETPLTEENMTSSVAPEAIVEVVKATVGGRVYNPPTTVAVL